MTFFKRLVALVFCAFLASLFLAPGGAVAKPKFSAVTVDARDGSILFDSDSNGLRHPASLTKMMTLYVLFQELKAGRVKMTTPLTVSARASRMAPSKLGLKPGSTITVKDAIMALIIQSANDVAATVGENLGGSESVFATRMTKVARELGMSRTTFKNASGLPNPQQVTTARDMATLGLRMMRDFPQYYPYFRATSFTFKGRTIRTHNRLVGRFPGTDGIKTGYIRASGFNLVTSTKRGEKRLVGVVMGGKSGSSRNAYMMTMLGKAFPKAKDGRTIAALAGSSKGMIDPVAAAKSLPDKPVEAATPAVAATVAPDADDSAQLAAAAATAASEPAENSTEEPAETTEPQVLEATLADAMEAASGTKPKKLPFAVKPEKKQAEPVTVASLPVNWSVQVGKFDSKKSALAVVPKLKPDGLATAAANQAYTVAVKKNGKIFYRLLVSGYDEKSAKQSCAKAVKLGKDCVVLNTPQT